MQCHTFDLSAFHRAIWTVRERSRACGCVPTRQKLLGLERTLLGLLMKAERAKPETLPASSAPSVLEGSLSSAPPAGPDTAPTVMDEPPGGRADRSRSLRPILRPGSMLARAMTLHSRTVQDRARTMPTTSGQAPSGARREQARATRYRLRTAGGGPALADRPHGSASDRAPV